MTNLEEVKIELTNYCKRKCIHCSSDANTENIKELPIDIIKRIIDECSLLKVKSIVLTGGEATEYKQIEEIVSYIKKRGIAQIKLYTMCEPTEEKYQKIVDLTRLGLTEIIYSLTVSLTTDNSVTFENIEPFLIKISQINNLSFHYCLTTKTIQDIDKIEGIISKINQENFKHLSFLRYVEHGRGKDDLTLTSKNLKELKPKLINFYEKYKEKIHFGSPFNILNITKTSCTAGTKTMIIGFDGNVYPCDAMKYFDYMGSGGNIYLSNLNDIYNSEYFQSIRVANKNINEECQTCKLTNCKGGCLAQKMLEIIKTPTNNITARWYQENALRTMNKFESKEAMKLNAYTGIIGEYGEFFDYIKKLYTHNLSETKKQEIRELAPNEIGDLIWYLSTSLALTYDYTLDEVYEYILNLNHTNYKIDKNLINKASQNKDPLCPITKKSESYSIDYINNFLKKEYLDKKLTEQTILTILINLKKELNKLDYIETKQEAIIVVAEILIELATITKIFFNKNLSEILNDNIEKLRKRYPEGFDKNIASERISANKKYKEEIDYKTCKKRELTKNTISQK